MLKTAVWYLRDVVFKIAAIALLKVDASAIRNAALKLKEDAELRRLSAKPIVSANLMLIARTALLPVAKMDAVWMPRPEANDMISLYLCILICSF